MESWNYSYSITSHRSKEADQGRWGGWSGRLANLPLALSLGQPTKSHMLQTQLTSTQQTHLYQQCSYKVDRRMVYKKFVAKHYR